MLNATSDRPDVRGRPRPGTRTGRVWEIADEITREKGRRAERREVVERYVAENGKRNTASTQFQYWKKHHEERHEKPGRVSAPASPGELREVDPQPLKVASGRPGPAPSRYARSDGPGRGRPGHGTGGSR